jgi:flagellar motor switch protein FliN/FliY
MTLTDDLAAVGTRAGAAGPPDAPGVQAAAAPLSAIYDIPVQLGVVLGRATMPVSQLLRLGRGAVVELDRKVGEPVEVHVNNRLVARGEVVIVDDHLAITLTEMAKAD